MSTTDVEVEESEAQRVIRWRAERLERAGFEPSVAREIAARIEVDLHRAIGLLERGCAPETAARILL